MKVTARLTWIEEKILEKLLGNASLTLLYQSSAHKNCVSEMTQKYSLQGSTMTVFHLEKDVVVGVFILENFPRLVSEKPCTCAWFSLKRNNSSGISALFLNTKVIVDSEELIIFSLDGLSLSVTPLRGFTLALNDTVMNGLELNLGHGFLPVECEIFRVDGIKKNPSFIKKMVTAEQHRGKLLSALRAYKPYKDLVSEGSYSLGGPSRLRESRAFSTQWKSAFQGHLTRQAHCGGSDESSITKQYRVYSIKDGKSGETLPFMLCDSMGLEEGEEAGLCIDDIPHILQGCVPDRYQFNPCEPMKPKHSPHAASPPLKDRIHCVAFVLHINSVNTLSDKMVAKLKKIRKDVVDCGIGYVALLTNVEEYDEVLDDSFANMTETVTSLSQVQNVQKWLNIPIANILMVSNYASERRLEPMKDILVFAALRQMLRAADDALEDLLLEDTGNLAPF
ncbi:interferon-induced protein 44-like [Mus musculus]|uniref:interferon-induced protein 44-like n=1 Tax=Mus musculus TaxID=10090 RepID=UPI0000027989|nr:interferon-induced protein 44-like [Mus musculus]AAK07660.1 minor histocompatibility antigen precursor [Mus musculus]|eukprot:NP_112735.1 interferon-induced protein 44-like [Mus musculus]